MNKRKENNRHSWKQYRRFSIFFMIFMFLFLAIPQDYLHNHPLTSSEPEDCPAFNLKRAVNLLPGLYAFLFLIFLVALFHHRESEESFRERFFLSSLGSRAPPFFA